jgi:hypothetical protein
MKVILRLKIPPRLDDFLWKNFRSYRRREIRRRGEVAAPFRPNCELCGAAHDVQRLRNGGFICVMCRAALDSIDFEDFREFER